MCLAAIEVKCNWYVDDVWCNVLRLSLAQNIAEHASDKVKRLKLCVWSNYLMKLTTWVRIAQWVKLGVKLGVRELSASRVHAGSEQDENANTALFIVKMIVRIYLGSRSDISEVEQNLWHKWKKPNERVFWLCIYCLCIISYIFFEQWYSFFASLSSLDSYLWYNLSRVICISNNQRVFCISWVTELHVDAKSVFVFSMLDRFFGLRDLNANERTGTRPNFDSVYK